MEHLYDALVNYLNGHADEKEQWAVEQWIKENPHQFERWKAIWDASEKVGSKDLPNIEAAWSDVHSKIKSDAPVKTRKLYLRGSYLKIAASVLLLITLGFFFQKSNRVIYQATLTEQPFTLSDGSTVLLAQGSKMTRTRFNWGKKHRTISIEGEGFFDIQRDTTRPFIVETHQSRIEVLGTSFRVIAPKDLSHAVHVKSGTVSFARHDHPDKAIILTKDQSAQIIVDREGPVRLDKISADNSVATPDKLQFRDTPLEKVLNALEARFNIKFTWLSTAGQNCLLTAEFQKESIDEILTVISSVHTISFKKISNDSYQVSGSPCDNQ